MIVNEIIHDLNEIIQVHITTLMAHVSVEIDSNSAIIRQIRIGDSVKCFKKIQLVRDNFMKWDHTYKKVIYTLCWIILYL